MVGDIQGRLYYYENDPVDGIASFTLSTTQVTDNNGAIIDVGQFATPQLFDVDNDGILDMLIGERNGNVNYYSNLGTVNNPSWSLQNDSIGGVVVTEFWNIIGHSVPFMFLNEQGEREMLVGSHREVSSFMMLLRTISLALGIKSILHCKASMMVSEPVFAPLTLIKMVCSISSWEISAAVSAFGRMVFHRVVLFQDSRKRVLPMRFN